MLTRAQAKTKECPLRAAGFWANPNDCISPSEGALNCRAEDCPKWRDAEMPGNCFGSGKGSSWHCEHVRHGGDMNACMDRRQNIFGYCGN